MKRILLPVGTFLIGLLVGGGVIWLLAINGPMEMLKQDVFGSTREYANLATLLKQKKNDEAMDIITLHLGGGLYQGKLFGPEKLYLENVKYIRGYYALVAQEKLPPLIELATRGTPDVTVDPRPMADLGAKCARDVLAKPEQHYPPLPARK